MISQQPLFLVTRDIEYPDEPGRFFKRKGDIVRPCPALDGGSHLEFVGQQSRSKELFNDLHQLYLRETGYINTQPETDTIGGGIDYDGSEDDELYDNTDNYGGSNRGENSDTDDEDDLGIDDFDFEAEDIEGRKGGENEIAQSSGSQPGKASGDLEVDGSSGDYSVFPISSVCIPESITNRPKLQKPQRPKDPQKREKIYQDALKILDVLFEYLDEKAEFYGSCDSTSIVESIHHARLFYLGFKTIFFERIGWRVNHADLVWNEGHSAFIELFTRIDIPLSPQAEFSLRQIDAKALEKREYSLTPEQKAYRVQQNREWYKQVHYKNPGLHAERYIGKGRGDDVTSKKRQKKRKATEEEEY
jgi:hypothetical protein